MKPILRNILAVIAGCLVGTFVNISLIKTGHNIFPIAGVDVNNLDALGAIMPTLGAKYFIFPFLAHAFGTLAGTFLTALIVTKNNMKFALGMGVFFLLGGIAACFFIPAPAWYMITDLLLAYLPMAWTGGKLAIKILNKS